MPQAAGPRAREAEVAPQPASPYVDPRAAFRGASYQEPLGTLRLIVNVQVSCKRTCSARLSAKQGGLRLLIQMMFGGRFTNVQSTATWHRLV